MRWAEFPGSVTKTDSWQTHANVGKCRRHTFCIRNAFAWTQFSSAWTLFWWGWGCRGKLEKVSMWFASLCLAWRFRFVFLPRPQAVRLRPEQPSMDWPNSFVNVFRLCDTYVGALGMGAW